MIDFNPLKLYDALQTNLPTKGVLMIEIHGELGEDKLNIRICWFPTGQIEKSTPMADLNFAVAKQLDHEYNYNLIAEQLAAGMKAGIEKQFPGIIVDLPNNQAHQEPEQADSRKDPPADRIF